MSQARFFYSLLFYAALPYALWRLFKRRGGAPWREYLAYGKSPPKDKAEDAPLVWLHAVSLGEASAALGLARHLHLNGYRLLFTHTTKSGRDWLRQRNDLNARICACPLDLPGATKRFIRKNRPQLAILWKRNFGRIYWPPASQEGLKLFLANARLGRKNAKRYSYVAPLMREMAGRFDIITAQSKADAKRLFFFGAKRVITTGNLKFDRAVNDRAVNIGRQWREDIKQDEKAIVLLAGTRPGEEKLLLDAMDNNFFAACFVILAPRHPERANEIASLLEKKRLRYSRRGKKENIRTADESLHLADTLGEMESFYACCDIALICGSFMPYGGQNPIEAMTADAPLLSALMLATMTNSCAKQKPETLYVKHKNAEEAVSLLRTLSANAPMRQKMGVAAKALCATHGGALNKTTDLIDELLHFG